MSTESFDVMIVGAGAAGLMAAIECRRRGLAVLILDGKKKIGAKILMSGGNRCNVTNAHVTEKDYESGNLRFVRNVLRAFPSERAVRFFKKLGVELVLEPGGKYFPATHSAKTVLNALEREMQKSGAELHTPRKVTHVRFAANRFQVLGKDFEYAAKTVVLCTGGLSHPGTGSDGAGYEIAKGFGHTLVFTTPALTPLLTDDTGWKSLSGISFPCRLTLWVDQKKIISFEGGFLFTHFGFSGPAALNLSRHWARLKNSRAVEITADFLPASSESRFLEELARAAKEHPSWQLARFLSGNLPHRFVEVFLKKIGLDGAAVLNQIRRQDRERLAQSLFRCPLDVNGVYGYAKAEATAGGINLDEVDSKTLESKRQPGLFFAGEILDADGRIGGFNFQWAWSTGAVAAAGIAKRIAKIT